MPFWLCLQLLGCLVKAAVHMYFVAPGALKHMLMLPQLQSSEEDSVEAQALVSDVLGCFKPCITEVAVGLLSL